MGVSLKLQIMRKIYSFVLSVSDNLLNFCISLYFSISQRAVLLLRSSFVSPFRAGRNVSSDEAGDGRDASA